MQATPLPRPDARPPQAPLADDVGALVGSDRVLAVLKELAAYPGGIGLDDLSRAVGSPKPTVHRALAALRRADLADRDSRGHYVLGDEFLRLAFAHHESRPDHVRIQPVLAQLAARFGETAHYAVLDGRAIVYRAKSDPLIGAVKLTSTVGGRNPAHATAVGKMLLSYQLHALADVQAWIGDVELERRTDRTLSTARQLVAEFQSIGEHGYAVDDQENEPGVNCLAVPVFLTSTLVPSGAVSVSALTYRTPLSVLVDALDEIRAAVPGAR